MSNFKNFFDKAINNRVSIPVISLFLTFFILWIYLNYFASDVSYDTFSLWSNSYQVIALFGTIFGLIASKRWGGTGSYIGRALLAFAIGLLLQCFGQTVYGYYDEVRNIEIAYPSIGDIGFVVSILFYIYGALMLAKAPRVQLSLKLIVSKIHIVLIPFAMLVLTFFIYLQNYSFDWLKPVKIFIDFGNPFIDAIAIVVILLAFSLSKEKLRGALNIPFAFFTVTLIVQYLADVVFIYVFNNNLYVTGGFSDLIYAISYILMALSLVTLSIWPSLRPE